MKQKPPETERRDCINRHRTSSPARTRDKIPAVLAYDDGYSDSEMNKIL